MIDAGLTVDLTVSPTAASGSMTAHGVTWQVVMVGRDVWVSGRELWVATLPADRAAALGDGWVRVTDPAAAFGFARLLPSLTTGIPDIIFGPHPGLAVTGSATVGGRRAVELRSTTDVYDVAAEGTPYPLRWLDSDLPGPGGQPCGITLDGFGSAVRVTSPPDVRAVLTPAPSPLATAAPTASPFG